MAKYFVALVDALFYVFLAAITASVHRLFTNRRMWTRYTARTVVIVDSTVNYKLLRAYVSKLRALAYRFTAFAVAGQNGVDHFVHEMTHLTHSDVLLCVGRMDGRLSALAASESALIMSCQQARYVSSTICGGVEAISLGHNPWTKQGLFTKDVVIPTRHRPEFLSEKMLNTADKAVAPGDVMHQVAALARNRKTRGTLPTTPWVEMPDLLKRFGGKTVVPLDTAKEVVKAIVAEQALRLHINPTLFETSRVFAGKRSNSLDTPGPLGSGNDSPVGYSSPGSPSGNGQTSPSLATGGSRKLKVGWLMASTLGGPPATITVSQVMALLRGKRMQHQILELQASNQKAELVKNLLVEMLGRPDDDLVRDAFAGWLGVVAQDLADRKMIEQGKSMLKLLHNSSVENVKPTSAHSSRPPSRCKSSARRISAVAAMVQAEEHDEARGEWRKKEEMRRNARNRLGFMMGISPPTCFHAWKNIVWMSRAASGKCRPVKKDLHVIGNGLVGKAEGRNLLAELRVVETLYESRIAAAERLVGFFVMFHQAVLPLSKLPGLNYDIDRSESRLRVASTPAPVSFVEELRNKEALYDAVIQLQRFFRKRRAAIMAAEEAGSESFSGCGTPTGYTKVKRSKDKKEYDMDEIDRNGNSTTPEPREDSSNADIDAMLMEVEGMGENGLDTDMSHPFSVLPSA
eukprot:TRINITY_DN49696_c0_g1_i1.p1 TRINITY_DN49696_c0_g1~~TRINITY_DN49696_c0_g1_i1.p1  ORF type:complete len:798 (+),score=136.65 TRINITY_DN49696_c0_g1_i1:335-2395(+)